MKLFERFPRPWTVRGTDIEAAGGSDEAFVVKDVCGTTVIFSGVYIGDGDTEFHLNRAQTNELVRIVNEANNKTSA